MMRSVSLNVIGKFFIALIISVNHFALRFKTLHASFKKAVRALENSFFLGTKFLSPRRKL